MNRLLTLLLLTGLALSATPAHAQLGRLRDRARQAVERTANRATDRAAENASDAAADQAADAVSPERAEVEAAAEALAAAWDAHYEDFAGPNTAGFNFDRISRHGWPDAGVSWLADVEAAEALFATVHPHMQVLHAHLGEDSSISNGLHRLGLDRDGGYAYDRFIGEMEAVAQFRRDVAADAVISARHTMEGLREHGDVTDIQVRMAGDVHTSLVMAQRFDPHSEGLNDLLAEAEGFAGEMQEQMMAQIEASRWPGHAGGAPSNLASGILDYFRSHPSWGGEADVEVLAVAVRGGWQPAKHNIIGQVIQWRLPIVVASVTPAWREHGAGRMFELSVLTQEGNPARQGPPYDGYWVGESGFIRLDRVPGP